MSQLQCVEILKPAIKSQEVLVLKTHNRVMYHFKVPLTSSKVSLFGSLVLVSQHVEEYTTVTLFAKGINVMTARCQQRKSTPTFLAMVYISVNFK